MIKNMSSTSKRSLARKYRVGGALLGSCTALFAVAGCSSDSASDSNGSATTAVTTLNIAAVDNPQMQDIQELLPEFKKLHPEIEVNLVFMDENALRAEVTENVTTNTARYDLFTIGTYEAPIWAKNGWIENLQPYVNKTPSYEASDLIAGVSAALSYQSNLYALPIYGESSMIMYRKDMLQAAGAALPEKPTWDEVKAAAALVHDPSKGISGICLRGKPGWGEQLAPMNTVVNTFGGSWFDMQWEPKLTSPKFKAAAEFYTDLIKTSGEPDPISHGFSECLTAYNEGKVAIWYDATVGASNFRGDAAANSGYAYAPTQVKPYSGWLWAWALGIPSTSTHKDAAWELASWVTSKDYIKLVGNKLGWSHVPPGTRTSTYRLPEYLQVAGSYALITLDSIAHADVTKASVDPVPYTGIQTVGIPEFAELGNKVSAHIGGVLAGTSTLDEALEKSQADAEEVGKKYR